MGSSVADRRRLRTFGAWLAALAAAAILIATLRSEQHSPYMRETFGHWCLVCGRFGVADVLQNVVLFVPLGAGLALVGASRRRALAAALALSAGIELAQHFLLSGRFATVSDVVTNSLGGWAGALLAHHWPVWLRPSPATARRLAAGTIGGWLASLAVATWAFEHVPSPGPHPPAVGDLPAAPMMGWFAGTVHTARFGDLQVAHRGTGPVIIGTATGRAVEGAVRVTGSDPRPFVVPMLYVHGVRDSQPELVIGQVGHAAVVQAELRARRLRLRQPSLRLPDVFSPEESAAGGVQREIAGGFADGTFHITARAGGVTRSRTLTLTAVMGWALLLPYVQADGAEADLMTALWIGGFLLPLGYWLAWTVPAGSGWPGRLRVGAIALGAAAAGLLVLPALARAAAPPPWVWGVVPAAVGAGIAASDAVRRRRRRVPPAAVAASPAA